MSMILAANANAQGSHVGEWRHRDAWDNPAQAASFDRKNTIGLHRLALKVADADALHILHSKLANCAGVEIEFAPEALGAAGTQHIFANQCTCRLPVFEFIKLGNAGRCYWHL